MGFGFVHNHVVGFCGKFFNWNGTHYVGPALGPPRGGAPGGGGGGSPPKPGDRSPWVPEVEGAIALMFNFFSFITLLRLRLQELSLSLSFVITNDRFRV